jgi:hypothetical protein
MAEPSDVDRYDCGCLMWNEGETAYFKPCAEDCTVYALLIEESRKRGNSIIERPLHDVPTLRADAGRCPHCFKLLDGHQALEGHDQRPGPGDVTVCFGCAAVLVFDDQLEVRAATDQERTEAMSQPEVARFVRMLQEHHG